MNDFKFNGMWLSTFGGHITEKPPIEIAEREYEVISTVGKNGDDYIDKGKFKNVEFERKIGFAPKTKIEQEALVQQLTEWLTGASGYCEFEDTEHIGMVTDAVLVNFAQVVKQLHFIHTATLKFSRKPYWYSKDGRNKQESATGNFGITLRNPYNTLACPYYEITLAQSLAVGSHSVTIVRWDQSTSAPDDRLQLSFDITSTSASGGDWLAIIVDTERDIAYLKNMSQGKILQYCASDVSMMKYQPNQQKRAYIYAGSNKVNKLTIIPNWRRL